MLRDRLRDRPKRTMFPHTVTVYNVTVERDEEYRDIITNHITVLRGVFLDATKAVNVRESGLVGADAVDLYIPLDVKAVDGVTGEPKAHIGPMEWSRLEDKTGYWTMTLDGQGQGDSFFIKGEVVEPDLSLSALSGQYDGVYNITKVDLKDFGGLPHWEVGGA